MISGGVLAKQSHSHTVRSATLYHRSRVWSIFSVSTRCAIVFKIRLNSLYSYTVFAPDLDKIEAKTKPRTNVEP